MQKDTYKGQADQAQIDAWKAQHGEVSAIICDGRICYLKKPSRKALSYASSIGTKDPIKFNELSLNDCFLGGDEAFKTDDSFFLAASAQIPALIEVKEAELVKL